MTETLRCGETIQEWAERILEVKTEREKDLIARALGKRRKRIPQAEVDAKVNEMLMLLGELDV